MEGPNERYIWTEESLIGTPCVIKDIRTDHSGKEVLEAVLPDLRTWRSLSTVDKGAHVLPCWGACIRTNNKIGLIYPQSEQGNIIEYLKRYPRADRIDMIKHIAMGLKIMHERNPQIIHGDLRAANIVINDQGQPAMTNLQLSANIRNALGVKSNTLEESLNIFPEDLEDNGWTPTSASDIYAFAMTALETFTEELAYTVAGDGSNKNLKRALKDLSDRKLPERPTGNEYLKRGLNDRMWALLNRCWAVKPEERPSIDEIIYELSAAY